MADDQMTAVLRRFFAAVSFEEGGRPAYAALHDLFLTAES